MAFKRGMMEWLGKRAARKNTSREDNYTYDPEAAALAEGLEVFEPGYIDPRAVNYKPSSPPPPVSPVAAAVAAPVVAAQNFAQDYQANVANDPDMQKMREIQELDALMEQGLQDAGEIFARRTGEEPLPSEVPPAQMPVYGETPLKNEAAQLQRLDKEARLDKGANQLTDVLKEMNKAVKMLAPQVQPDTKMDKVGSSGMPDWATAAPAPAPTPAPAPAPAPAPVAPTPAPQPVAESYENLIFSDTELQNIGSMTDADVPTDRMILPMQYNTMEEAAADFDRLDAEEGFYPPVVYIKNPPQYIDVTSNPDLAPFVMGPEQLKAYNSDVLLRLKLIEANTREQQLNQGIKQINERL